MRLSTRGRFAITALMDLALCEPARPLPLQDIAQRHHISLSYLEQIFARLRQAGLVVSTRGPGGGYTLGAAAKDISVADIVLVVEESLDPSEETDPTMPLWSKLREQMLAHMQDISLHSLVADRLQAGERVVDSRKSGLVPSLKAQSKKLPKPRFGGLRVVAPNSVFALAHAPAAWMR